MDTESRLVLDLLVLDAERISGVPPSDYDDPVQYATEVYSVASHRAHTAPQLHKQAWTRLAEYVAFRNWTTLDEIYGLFARLYPYEERSLLSILPPGVSFWHIRCCLWVWAETRPERLKAVTALHCFLNMTPQEAEARLKHAHTLNAMPYLFRLSTTKPGVVTLSFVTPLGRIVHARLDEEAVQRFIAQSRDDVDLYTMLFNESWLKLGQPVTLSAQELAVALQQLGLRVSLSEVFQYWGEARIESARVSETLAQAFYPGRHTVQLEARSLNELVGLTASYIAGYA